MNDATLDAVDADAAALASASTLADEALALHRDALAVIAEGWSGESSCAAEDLIRRQCGDAAEIVAALHGATAEFRSLRDIFEEAGSVAHGTPGAAVAQPEQSYAQTTARLNDRPQPSFEAPAAPIAPAPTPSTPSMWPPVAVPLPGVGGALLGLIAQAVDALGADAATGDLVGPADPADPVQPAAESAPPPDRSVVAPPQPQPPPQPSPALPPAGVTTTPADDPVRQPESPPQLPPQSPPQPEAGPELLAAERPPQPEAPQPTEATPTPCEIAVDELPQVGG